MVLWQKKKYIVLSKLEYRAWIASCIEHLSVERSGRSHTHTGVVFLDVSDLYIYSYNLESLLKKSPGLLCPSLCSLMRNHPTKLFVWSSKQFQVDVYLCFLIPFKFMTAIILLQVDLLQARVLE